MVLGLIFLEYVSDAFEERRIELEKQFRDSSHEYYLTAKHLPALQQGKLMSVDVLMEYVLFIDMDASERNKDE